MTKNTIDDHTGQYMLFGCECGRQDSETIADVLGGEVTENLKQALYQDLMDCLPEKMGPMELDWQQHEINGRNQAVDQMQQNINQYFKRGDGDD